MILSSESVLELIGPPVKVSPSLMLRPLVEINPLVTGTKFPRLTSRENLLLKLSLSKATTA